MAGGFALEVITVGGFTVGLGVTTSTCAALMGLGLATATYHAKDISFPKHSKSSLSSRNSNIECVNNDKHQLNSSKDPNRKDQERRLTIRKKLQPDSDAQGSHTVFKRNAEKQITKYETYQAQTNSYNQKPWKSVKRYDGLGGKPHWNKVLEEYINTPYS